MAPKAILDSPRSGEDGAAGLGLDSERISADAMLLTDPTAALVLRARWLGKKTVDAKDSRLVYWEKLRVADVVYYVNDMILATPERQGSCMELSQIVKLFDTGTGSQGNRRQMTLRWFWRPLQLGADHDAFGAEHVNEYLPNECFYTDSESDVSTDAIEGYALQC